MFEQQSHHDASDLFHFLQSRRPWHWLRHNERFESRSLPQCAIAELLSILWSFPFKTVAFNWNCVQLTVERQHCRGIEDGCKTDAIQSWNDKRNEEEMEPLRFFSVCWLFRSGAIVNGSVVLVRLGMIRINISFRMHRHARLSILRGIRNKCDFLEKK